MIRLLLFAGMIMLLGSCGQAWQGRKELPVLGEKDEIDGKTVFHTIPEWQFLNQDSQLVSLNDYRDKVHIAEFFFTSCPSICPVVKKQLLRVWEKYRDNDRVAIVSFSIDPKRDTPERLHQYAANLGISAPKWQLLTGEKDAIYSLATDYFSIALETDEAPGGFDHSGRLILVDPEGKIRSFCNGTDEVEVTRFLKDIDVLLEELETTVN